MELNRDEIIKALECCTSGINHKGDIPCLDCPYDECNIVGGTSERQITGTCSSWLKKDTLSLIKELIEENERLRAENEALAISEVKECEISQMLVYRIRNKHPAVMAVIADTVRKMQERLTTLFANDETLEYTEVDAEYINEQIVRIAKEIMEGDNEASK